jgi:hypothetical protein
MDDKTVFIQWMKDIFLMIINIILPTKAIIETIINTSNKENGTLYETKESKVAIVG